MRRAIVVVISILAVAMWAELPSNAVPAQTTDPFINTIAQMKRSVAPIACELAGRVAENVGTGFFISDHGDFVTALHVVTTQKNVCRYTIDVPVGGWQPEAIKVLSQPLPFTCVSHPDFDVAVCQVTMDIRRMANIGITPVEFEPDVQRDGTAVAVTGFPNKELQPVTVRTSVAQYGTFGVRPEGADPATTPPSRSIAGARLTFAAAYWPGMSGAPIYLADGRVIGVALRSGTGATNAGLSYGIRASYIVPLVQRALDVTAPTQRN